MAAREVPKPSRTIEKRYVQLESCPADPDGKAEAEAIEPAAERRAYPEEQTRLWKFIDGVFLQLRHDCPIFGILVIGETGTGKSTLINNLLGREVAVIGHTLESETQLVTPYELTVEGVPVVVYDTPGLDDTKGDDDEKHLEIMKSLLARKKIHLVIYCIKLTETRMRRGLIHTFKEYHKIGVPWEQTVVTITFADVIGDTTARFTQMQQHLKKILVEKVGVTSSVVDVLKICPTAKDPTAALPSGKQWYVPFWLDVVQVLVPAALVQFLHIHKDNIQIGEGTPVSRHPNPVNITLVGEDQKRFQREVDRLPELQATSVALPTGPAFPGPPQPTPVRAHPITIPPPSTPSVVPDPVATTPLPMGASGGIPPSQAGSETPSSAHPPIGTCQTAPTSKKAQATSTATAHPDAVTDGATTTTPPTETTVGVLVNFRDRFIKGTASSAIMYELKHKGVISSGDVAMIERQPDVTQQNQYLHECLTRKCTKEALMEVCNVMTAVRGNPKMNALGKDMRRRLKAPPSLVHMVLEKYEEDFFKCVNAKLRLRRLIRRGVIVDTIKGDIESSNDDEAREILFDHLKQNANVDTLKEYLKVAVAADGYPNMQLLGRKMMEELQQGVQRRTIVTVLDAHRQDLDVTSLTSDLKDRGVLTAEQCQKLASLDDKEKRHEALLYTLLAHDGPDTFHKLVECMGLRDSSTAADLQATFKRLVESPGALSIISSSHCTLSAVEEIYLGSHPSGHPDSVDQSLQTLHRNFAQISTRNEDVMAEECVEVEVKECAEKMACVRIDSEEFSIVVPSSGTAVVRKEKEHLLGSIDLPALVEDLGRVVNFVRLAYNGYDVTKLCNKSEVTVSKFKQASGSILDDLQGTYQFLLDGLEDIALETLASLSEVAKVMATAAEELHKDFDDESLKVDRVLKDTMKEKRDEERKKKEIEEKRRKFEMDRIRALMLKVALFWKKMQMHCETLARDKMQKMIMSAMKRPKKERLRVWTATGFKTHAIKYNAQWVALDDVCAIYMAKIKKTQKTIYSYLTENPTLSESRANVRQLAIQFSEDLKRAHSEIDEKNAADEEEIARMLESGV